MATVTPMLARNYDPTKHNIIGWDASEKLDGVRALWDGSRFWTRNGNILDAPYRITGSLAKRLDPLQMGRCLDGELYIGRGRFNECSGIVRRHGDEWIGIEYHVFDYTCNFGRDSDQRQDDLKSILQLIDLPFVKLVPQIRINSLAHLTELYDEVIRQGGEGLMLKNPNAEYLECGPTKKRSPNLLKVKSFHETEAIVTGYVPGLGKYRGLIGALICRLPSGKSFNCGSGLLDSERAHYSYFAGQTITVKYFEMSKDGVPRFPIYKGIRHDA
jgi:DNA ligase-1